MAGESNHPSSIEILIRANAISGDPKATARWYATEPLSAFQGKTAKELVEKDGRAQDVLEYLDHIDAGPLS